MCILSNSVSLEHGGSGIPGGPDQSCTLNGPILHKETIKGSLHVVTSTRMEGKTTKQNEHNQGG